MAFEYSWDPGPFIAQDEPSLIKMVKLYSNHYGKWSHQAPFNQGKPIRLSAEKLKPWLESKDSKVASARLNGELIGYAIALQTTINYGVISWVTQLVVHKDYRNQDIGKELLFSIWSFNDHFAWGLVSANPYAIRALEKATRRRCNSERIFKNRTKLLNLGKAHVPYIQQDTELMVRQKENLSKINTKFFLDHSELPKMLKSVIGKGKPWLLGDLEEGWEWFAFTFKDQEQICLSPGEIEKMLEASDQVTQRAYSRMLLEKDSHAWARHSTKEAKFLAEIFQGSNFQTLLDFGCGIGRHSFPLAEEGFQVTGVDYVKGFISKATEIAKENDQQNVKFITGDCRDINLGEKFDSAICLYDVVGTYADNTQNRKILRNLSKHVKDDGLVAISVMNYDLTDKLANKYFSIKTEPDKLLELEPSQTMETTGNIFNPDFFMIDTETKVIYRKEQFAEGTSLPTELIVRDRRFTLEEITEMCETVGLKVLWSKFVRAGRWRTDLGRDHDKAKEILLLCKKVHKSAELIS